MDIPVFHDDQHGTAIISAAGVINAAHLTGRKMDDIKVVVNGAGAAGIACLELLKSMGVPNAQCDPVRHQGRGLSRPHRRHEPVEVGPCRGHQGAHAGRRHEGLRRVPGPFGQGRADAGHGARPWRKAPIIFAMANPDPEITPEDAKAVRADAIVATGRSDYPNQVNNVLGFPYIFRGALDVRATTINEAMKIAAAEAIAALAREDVPDEVAAAYRGARPVYGPDYIIPSPFDPRLITRVSAAVAEAAMKTGVAKQQIDGSGRLSVPAFGAARSLRRPVPDGHQRGARQSQAGGVRRRRGGIGDPRRRRLPEFRPGQGDPGRPRRCRQAPACAAPGSTRHLLEIRVPHSAQEAAPYIEALYKRMQRRGALYRDAVRMVTNDRNIYAASMLKAGDADAMVTGVTRNYADGAGRCAHRARSAARASARSACR